MTTYRLVITSWTMDCDCLRLLVGGCRHMGKHWHCPVSGRESVAQPSQHPMPSG